MTDRVEPSFVCVHFILVKRQLSGMNTFEPESCQNCELLGSMGRFSDTLCFGEPDRLK